MSPAGTPARDMSASKIMVLALSAMAAVVLVIVMIVPTDRTEAAFTSNAAATTEVTVQEATYGLVFDHVDVGRDHSCGVTSDGYAYCWGNDDADQLGAGLNVTDMGNGRELYTPHLVDVEGEVTDISAGEDYTCAVVESVVHCWGTPGWSSWNTPTSPEPVASGSLEGVEVASVEVGQSFACAIDSDGAAHCWGISNSGELGDGREILTTSSLVYEEDPVAVAGGNQFASISVSVGSRRVQRSSSSTTSITAHTVCGVTVSGSAMCWGNQANGTIGDGGTEHRSAPTPVGGALLSKNVVDIDANAVATCAVTEGGEIYCWGEELVYSSGSYTKRTYLSEGNAQIPLVLASGFTDLVRHNDANFLLPTRVASPAPMTSVSVGREHACTISVEPAVYCWGTNTAVGVANEASGSGSAAVPIRVDIPSSDSRVVSVDASWYATYAVDSDGAAWGWGRGNFGTGRNSSSVAPTPVRVAHAVRH